MYSFTKPSGDNENHILNAGGHFVTRVVNILKEILEIIWMMTKIFRHIINNNKYGDLINNVFRDDADDYLISAINGCYLTDYYYLSLHNLKDEFKVK